MSAHASPNIITDGLAFMYDTGSGKSYRGEPTINYIHSQNAVAKDSYSTWSATAAGTYNAKHPNAIVAYNAAGSQISGYYNGGVSDATNTYHAHWQLDPILKKPVVVMNDLVGGQWKAKWMGTGLGSWNSQGKSHGDTYTISWLQWVDHLSKNAKAGLYTKNTSGSNGFHDGQANSASSYNTKLRTWQRVYQTYTTNSVRDLSQTLASIYMYGHYNVRATVKVADVQFTWGSHPAQFSAEYERTATQGLLDLTGNRTIDLSNVSFDSNADITFDGTDDYISIPTYTFGNGSWTLNMWVNVSAFANYNLMSNSSGGPVSNVFGAHGSNPKIFYMNYDGAWKDHYGNTTLSTNNWYMLTWVNYVGASASQGTMKMYVNGVADSSVFNSYTTNGGPCNVIGKRWGGTPFNGKISGVSINTKSLSDAEVRQNYNATKGRFGL